MAAGEELTLRKVEEGSTPGDGTGRVDAVFQARESVPEGAEFVLGFGRHLVPAFATINVFIESPRQMRIKRLIISSDVADDFMVVDMKIGKDSQLLSRMEIPARVFSESNAHPPKIAFDVCYHSIYIAITVRNIDHQAHEFKAALVCEVV